MKPFRLEKLEPRSPDLDDLGMDLQANAARERLEKMLSTREELEAMKRTGTYNAARPMLRKK